MRYKVNMLIMHVGNSTQDHATLVVVMEVHYHLPQPMHLWLNKVCGHYQLHKHFRELDRLGKHLVLLTTAYHKDFHVKFQNQSSDSKVYNMSK